MSASTPMSRSTSTESSAGAALAGRFLEQIEDLHHVAAGAAGDEEIEEDADEQRAQ